MKKLISVVRSYLVEVKKVTFCDISLFVNQIHDISFVYQKNYLMNLHFHSNFDKLFQMIEFTVIDIQK